MAEDSLVRPVEILTGSMNTSIFLTTLIDILETVGSLEPIVTDTPVPSTRVLWNAIGLVLTGRAPVDGALVNVLAVGSPISRCTLASIVFKRVELADPVVVTRGGLAGIRDLEFTE